MTTSATPSLRRLTPQAAVLLLVAAVRCLKHCRSPLSLLLHYGSYRVRCAMFTLAPTTGRTALASAGR